MGENDLKKSIQAIQAILAKILQEEEEAQALNNKRNVAKKNLVEAESNVNKFRINFLLDLLKDKPEKNKNVIQYLATEILKVDEEGYDLYREREKAKRKYEDADFDVNRFNINFLLELLSR